MFHRYGREFFKTKSFSHKNHLPEQYGQIAPGRDDVGPHQGPDTLDAFVRNSSRVSGGISVSSVYNKAQTSQICERDKYPTVGVALSELSMCTSSMCPTTEIILSSQTSISNGMQNKDENTGKSLCQSFRTVDRTECLDTTIYNCQTG